MKMKEETCSSVQGGKWLYDAFSIKNALKNVLCTLFSYFSLDHA
jgi:hypothetical protein